MKTEIKDELQATEKFLVAPSDQAQYYSFMMNHKTVIGDEYTIWKSYDSFPLDNWKTSLENFVRLVVHYYNTEVEGLEGEREDEVLEVGEFQEEVYCSNLMRYALKVFVERYESFESIPREQYLIHLNGVYQKFGV